MIISKWVWFEIVLLVSACILSLWSWPIILSYREDCFFVYVVCSKNFAANFGEIGTNIKELMEEFQRKSHQQGKVESIADMKKFIGE